MAGEDVVERAEAVVAERVLDDAVLLDPDADRYVRLNATGAALWDELARPRSIAELTRALARSAQIAEAQAAADVEEFVRELERRALVTVRRRPARG